MTDLTEQYLNGQLRDGDEYYIENKDGETSTMCLYNDTIHWHSFKTKKLKILAKVPSYEEWDKLNNACHELEKETACLTVDNINLKQWCEEFNALEVAKENTKLKELLKECKEKLIYCTISTHDVQAKINQVLGE